MNSFIILLMNCISARSAPQILSLKDEYTFLFSNFLIIGLCNFSTNCWFYLISFLIPLPVTDLPASEANFLSKNL